MRTVQSNCIVYQSDWSPHYWNREDGPDTIHFDGSLAFYLNHVYMGHIDSTGSYASCKGEQQDYIFWVEANGQNILQEHRT